MTNRCLTFSTLQDPFVCIKIEAARAALTTDVQYPRLLGAGISFSNKNKFFSAFPQLSVLKAKGKAPQQLNTKVHDHEH